MIRKKERKKGPVWKHFNSISKHDDSHPHVQCIYCLKDFQRAVPERMQAHLDKKCPSAPNDAKSQSVQQNNSTSIIDYTDNINEEIVRKRGSVWKNFHIIGKYGDSHPSVQCKYCSKEFKRAVPQRMQTHIEKCEQVPNNVKSKFQQNTIKINNINDYMSEEEQKSLESLLAKALSSAKIQFSFVDNPFVIQFFNHLRPSFKLPNGEEIKIQMSQTQSLNDITYHPEYCHQFEIKTEDGSDIDTDSTIDLECESESKKRTIFESCKEAAEKGDIKSIFKLGRCYANGIGTEKNEIKAFESYKEAVEEVYHVESMYQLGCCYENGIGTEKNEIKAFELYKEAAELGCCYANGIGTEENEIKTFELYKKAAEEAYHAQLMYELGRCYKNGIGTEKNEIKAFESYKEAVEEGDHVESMYELGCCYKNGIGTEKNEIKAFESYKEAAEEGYHVESMYELGCCYKNGIGTEKNKITAFKLYKEAAEKGHVESMYELGCCYANGIGTEKNEIKAFESYKEAAKKGHVESVYELGCCYENGIGTEKNEIKAFELYEGAAEKGDLNSMYKLGCCYRYGIGTGINVIKSFEYYNKAEKKS